MRTHLFALLLLISYTLVYPQTKNLKNLKPEMNKVEGGTFMMGNFDTTCIRKFDVHLVTLSSFYIGTTEVTQEQWESVMGSNPSYFKGDKRPVEQVSWYEMIEFCNKLSEKEGFTPAYKIDKTRKDPSNENEYDELKWLVTCDFTVNGYRLPTEAEWEYAAMGGNLSKGYKYSGSNGIGEVSWYESNSGGQTHDVGIKQANELGLYDMSGNVFEWCWDWFRDYGSESKTNPSGASAGSSRVFRGGCWSHNAENCRVDNCNSHSPDNPSDFLGFRIVRTK